jgi:hypothetical protein
VNSKDACDGQRGGVSNSSNRVCNEEEAAGVCAMWFEDHENTARRLKWRYTARKPQLWRIRPSVALQDNVPDKHACLGRCFFVIHTCWNMLYDLVEVESRARFIKSTLVCSF